MVQHMPACHTPPVVRSRSLDDAVRSDSWVGVHALAGDASSRRYLRLTAPDGSTAVLARYPHDPPTFTRDLEVLTWLRERGLRVPALLAADGARLEMVVEDLGPSGAAETLAAATPGRRVELAARLLGPLATLAAIPPAELPGWNQPLAYDRLRWELAGFQLWYVRDRVGASPGGRLDHLMDDLARTVAEHPRRVCHRDYHVDNLFLLLDGEVGVIDVQDVLVGPDTYDLASLVGERALPELLSGEECAELALRWAGTTGAEPGWEGRLEEVRLQRGLKVLGTFARLGRSGRPGYERFIAPLARRLVPLCRRLVGGSVVSEILLHSCG